MLSLVMWILYSRFDAQLMDELAKEAKYLSISVQEQGLEALEGLDDADQRITLIGEDGQVLYDNYSDPAQMDNHMNREEIEQARRIGYGKAVRQSDTLEEKTLYYALRLPNGGFLRVSSNQYTVVALLLGLIGPFFWILFLVLVLSALVAFRLSKKIVLPLNQLDLECPENNEAYNEIAPLLTKISRQQSTIREQLADTRHQQEQFDLITASMEEGLLVIDQQANVLSANASAFRLLGTDPVEGHPSVLCLNRSEPFRTAVEMVLTGQHREAILEHEGICCAITANPVLHEDKMEGAVLLLVDVTEQRQREQLRREFTANVSHELKTPLTSISGFAEIIRDGMVRPEDIPNFAGRIFTESQRLITLVSDIIKISQLDENAISYAWERLDLTALVQEELERLRPAADRKGVTLKLEGEQVSLLTVRPIVEEIVHNLCDNAIKYNRPDGTVEVSVCQQGEATILKVRDTGIGIAPGDQQHIFERFYRVDKSHSKEIGGTGLGLSIVKHGAAYLGAKTGVESTLGVGTIFTLTWEKQPSVLD